MDKCVETIGLEADVLNYDSGHQIYKTFCLKATHPEPLDVFRFRVSDTLARLKERSARIIWRITPKMKFVYINKDTDELPTEEDYRCGLAQYQVSFRLMCYPELTAEEERAFGL